MCSLPTIIAEYNTNTIKIYNILSLLWQKTEGKYNKAKVGIKFCRFYYNICIVLSYDDGR